MQVDFYTFSKRENSTARPTSSAESTDCVLKETSGVINPNIALQMGMNQNPSLWNYAYIPDFGRYYFVREWTWERGIWYGALEVDALASWKESIGGSTQYVLRAASQYSGKILDTVYPTTSDISHVRVAFPMPWQIHLETGYYVVGIIGNSENTLGAVNYYTFTQSEMNDFNDALMKNTDWLNVPTDEISDELLKALYNPYQYVVSCNWFPLIIPLTEAPAVSTIQFGWWSIKTNGRRLRATATSFSATADLPKHPQAATRGEYLNLSPYSRYTLFFPPFGMIPLDTTQLCGSSVLNYTVLIDYVSGMGRLTVAPQFPDGNSPIINTSEAQCCVPIQLAQIATDYLAASTTAIQGAADVIGAVAKGDVAGGISSFASGIDSTIRASLPQLMTSGSNGSTANFITAPQLYAQFFNLVQEYITNLGRPLCEPRVINTLTGYILVSGAEVQASCTRAENETITDMMEGGFFYE